MELPEIKRRLDEAMPLRIPLQNPDAHPRERISELEDHILKCAWHRAELEEALHWTIEIGKRLRVQWDGIDGWQVAVRGSRPTRDQIDAAKRTIDGERGTWDALQECRTLVESLKRQITRLGGSDYDAASRAYTLLSGS